MSILTKFERRYLELLDNQIREYRHHAKKKEEEDNYDESVLEKIKANVSDIFRKMFALSEKRLREGHGDIPHLRRIFTDHAEDYERLFHMYLYHLDSIPRNWRVSLARAAEHDDPETYVKEKVKCETVAEIEQTFRELYREYYP